MKFSSAPRLIREVIVRSLWQPLGPRPGDLCLLAAYESLRTRRSLLAGETHDSLWGWAGFALRCAMWAHEATEFRQRTLADRLRYAWAVNIGGEENENES